MLSSGLPDGDPRGGWLMTSLRWYHLAIALAALLLLVSCTTEQKTAANPPETVSASTTKPKMPQPVTAAQALDKIQGFAQKQWAADALPVHLESSPNTEANGQDGKATVWTGVFASQQKGQIRTFTWSGSLQPDAPVRGVSGAPNEFPLTAELASQVFQSFLIKADSDRALAVAQEHGGDALLKKFPDQHVKYMIAFDPKSNAPMMYVIYGDSIKNNKGFGVIHAISGTYLRGGKSGS